MLLIFLLLAAIASILVNMIDFRKIRKLSCFAIVSIMIVIYGVFLQSLGSRFPISGDAPLEYNVAGDREFFSTHTQPGDIIGMTGGGLEAYFIPDRTFINLDGLINSADYFYHLQEGTVAAYLTELEADYIYGSPLILLDSDPYRWFFTDRLMYETEGKYFALYRFVY